MERVGFEKERQFSAKDNLREKTSGARFIAETFEGVLPGSRLTCGRHAEERSRIKPSVRILRVI